MEVKEGSILDCQIVAWLQSFGSLHSCGIWQRRSCGSTVGGRHLKPVLRTISWESCILLEVNWPFLKSITHTMIALKGVKVFPVAHAVDTPHQCLQATNSGPLPAVHTDKVLIRKSYARRGILQLVVMYRDDTSCPIGLSHSLVVQLATQTLISRIGDDILISFFWTLFRNFSDSAAILHWEKRDQGPSPQQD